MRKAIQMSVAALAVLAVSTAFAKWDPAKIEKRHGKAEAAKAEMLEKSPAMQRYFDAAAGWVIIPTVGKGGIGIGGARGEGLLYDGGGNIIGEATMTQLTIGFQWGGQAYSQFMFFENQAALDKFKQGNYELGAQASAVAVTAGASVDAGFINGVAIFTYAKGGLMYEASVGGQKFSVDLK
jgi:lipid-binding SYLF domain-containing protein